MCTDIKVGGGFFFASSDGRTVHPILMKVCL